MDASPQSNLPADRPTGTLAAISNAMVRVYKDHYGRGPTTTRAHWAGPDTIVVTLEDTLTTAETMLRRLGEWRQLRDLRQAFQVADPAAFTAPVEAITGRKVRAFTSGLDIAADYATELFALHPAGHTDATDDIVLPPKRVAALTA